MISSMTMFLIVLLAIGILAKNQSLIIAVGFLLIVKWVGLGDKTFPFLQEKGIQLGVTVITIAVLVPIATGEIGFKEMKDSLSSYYAWIALAAGVLVAIIAADGIELLKVDPHMTTALVLGTVIAVAVFKGVAVGPLIGAGIAYYAMKIVDFFTSTGG